MRTYLEIFQLLEPMRHVDLGLPGEADTRFHDGTTVTTHARHGHGGKIAPLDPAVRWCTVCTGRRRWFWTGVDGALQKSGWFCVT